MELDRWNSSQFTQTANCERGPSHLLCLAAAQVYCLKQLRVLGENVRILFTYGGMWQVGPLVSRARNPYPTLRIARDGRGWRRGGERRSKE